MQVQNVMEKPRHAKAHTGYRDTSEEGHGVPQAIQHEESTSTFTNNFGALSEGGASLDDKEVHEQTPMGAGSPSRIGCHRQYPTSGTASWMLDGGRYRDRHEPVRCRMGSASDASATITL
ncbi:hypothetical protein GSI_10452 [Ganoderma sinense ZZ0214-1]|uniref:Uncharacterized protein n=1 Tax=Ganoderma sinense ZZ0214-1 TaxID=1077348 RepID=A0A2G8S0M9_9APHY|nr:hypothetical protein GSI_10452 [Ganoderma sinense ZZ0214-1]